MSPSKGRRPTPGQGGRGGAGRPARPLAVRRLGLLVFGAAFVVLFLVLAIAEGVGSPSVPAGDVAIVEDVPGGAGSISQADFEHSLQLAAAQAGLKKLPKPGEAKYEEIKTTALNSLFDTAWIEGLAAEKGIAVTPQEIAAKLKTLKKENFKTAAAYKKFLRESHYTQADVDSRVKLTILSSNIQAQITKGAPKPSGSEVADYYEEAKATQFTRKASRNVRLVSNKDLKKVEEAKALLEKAKSSAASWQKVAKKYSEDPATKNSGGLRSGLAEGMVEEPLNAAIFKAPEKRLEGPVKAAAGYF
ncbi:MAG TPA: SurA N-terminal domain-containing protein, partial [Solirubrobacterales bacterium]|nr:SurA N-terminal domain-containing protein [Solirubrobacterales bacterium]